jgi:tRNA 2-thiouridine synthesizing protein A
MNASIDKILDCTGLLCPEPVMLLHKAIREVAIGQIIQLIATDPSTQRDVAKFCGFLGHELVRQEEQSGKYFYLIKKGA